MCRLLQGDPKVDPNINCMSLSALPLSSSFSFSYWRFAKFFA